MGRVEQTCDATLAQERDSLNLFGVEQDGDFAFEFNRDS